MKTGEKITSTFMEYYNKLFALNYIKIIEPALCFVDRWSTTVCFLSADFLDPICRM